MSDQWFCSEEDNKLRMKMKKQQRLLYSTEASCTIVLGFHSDQSRWPGREKLYW